MALSGDYDFDHDGTPETVELVTIFGENGVSAGGYTLRIWKEGGTPIWAKTPTWAMRVGALSLPSSKTGEITCSDTIPLCTRGSPLIPTHCFP